MGGCLSLKLRRSSSVLSASSGEGDPGSTHFAVRELRNILRKRPDLQKVAKDLLESIVSIKTCLSDIESSVDHARSDFVGPIRAALVIYQHEKEVKELLQAERRCRSYGRFFPVAKRPRRTSSRKNFYDDTVAELRKARLPHLEGADDLPALIGELKDAMSILRRRKQEIEERLQSRKRWRKVWSISLNVVVVGVLVASVVLAALGAGPVAVAGATAGATVMKGALEPLVNSSLDDEEKALEEEKEIVEMMRAGEYLLEHELETVRALAGRVVQGVVVPLVDCVEMAGEGTEEAVALAMEELAKRVGEVEGSLLDLRTKVRSCSDKLQRSESDFIKVIHS